MKTINWTRQTALVAACTAMLAAGAGCQALVQDHYRANLHAEIVPAKFKPLVEPIRGSQVTTGKAKSLVAFWILPFEWPSKFSNDPTTFYGDWLKDAAVYEACQAAGADILIAPRFTEERIVGPLWFFRSRKVSVEGIPARIVGAQEIPVEKWPLLFGGASGTQLIKTVK